MLMDAGAAADKAEFLKEFGSDYGYPNGPKTIDEIRATEFKRLDQKNGSVVYLDHAGATLYSELQMEAIFKDLTSNIYANPHSQSDSSAATSDVIREARQQVLDYCNASLKEYKCIFTSGATAALKLVGEAFPWSRESCFVYTMENHNSVLGIREYALSHGAAAFAVDVEDHVHHGGISRDQEAQVKLLLHQIQRRNEAQVHEGEPTTGDACNLFAFPSECNFSGSRFSLDLVKLIKEDSERILKGFPFCKGRWMVLIDAAKGCSTKPPDLSKYPVDFAVISFYKLFGYPTGLGALIVHNDAAKLMKKTYFSGGTVAASFADVDFVKRKEGVEELFEDGTSSFVSIASIRQGFKILNSLTPSLISRYVKLESSADKTSSTEIYSWSFEGVEISHRHTATLTIHVKKILLGLRHENGANICTIYESHASKILCHESGPILSFNLKRPDGSWFGYREVEKLASLSGIQLRTGCFCNPGACAKYLGLSHLDLLSNLEAGRVCWDDNDIIQGKPTGAVRVSFGYMSTYEDAKKFIDFITSSFVSMPNKAESGNLLRIRPIPMPNGGCESTAGYYLKSITVYPIKSCAGFSVESWPLISTGLLHDREWLVKSLTGEILTQKKVPEMCFISTYIDLNEGIMFVESPRCGKKMQINLKTDSYSGTMEEVELHAQRYEVQHYQTDVDLWFSHAVGHPCTLLRCSSSESYFCLNKVRSRSLCRDTESRLNFVNEAQFLLIAEESVSDLNNKLISTNAQKGTRATTVQVDPMRFRPNLVISGGEPYVEDGWRNIRIGKKYFTSLGGCNRCQMINFVQQAGQVQRSNEPLATLASYRRVKGKILFGIFLRYDIKDEIGLHDSWLQVGEVVHPNSG